MGYEFIEYFQTPRPHHLIHELCVYNNFADFNDNDSFIADPLDVHT